MAEPEDRQRDDDEIARLTEALLGGRKIEAIKIYRDRTGCGLKEAKDEVEAMEANLRRLHPDKFSARPKGAGCAGMLLAALGTAVITTLACTAAAGLGFR